MPRPLGATQRTHFVSRMLEAYAEHRRMLLDAGHDPNFIGTTEVKPVCCEGCGKAIPWATLRGWQD